MVSNRLWALKKSKVTGSVYYCSPLEDTIGRDFTVDIK